MKIGIVVNDVDTERPTAATTVIARAMARAGHAVYMIGVGELTYHSDGRISALGRKAPRDGAESQDAFIAAIQQEDWPRTTIQTGDLDVLYLRYNPVEELANRPWEVDAGIVFCQMAVLHGVIVLSHPYTLSYAVNKMYLEQFPESVRPRSIITRSFEEVRRFYEEQDRRIVLKPVRGYGGQDVYLLDRDDTNMKQIVGSLARSSYIIAQEYLPAARDGDIRLFLFNGKPLVVDGKYAALRRVNAEGDFRSNMTAGGKPAKAEITPRILEIAEAVRPRLVADGIFDAGIDIVGDKLVEINAISAGGLNAAGRLEGVDFGPAVVELIERKVEYRRKYGQQLRNRELAVME
ncbi:MAG: glutathione synthase [Candidatus Cloacimonetes bacterium]|nr:glutathione synthase [Candidatus Cloacimonadota bacterium]